MTNIINYSDAYVDIVQALVVLILIIFFIINAGTTISDEFSKGTVKQLLITPNKRWKILLSKIFVLIVNLLFFTLVVSILTQIIAHFIFKMDISDYIYYSNNKLLLIDGDIFTIFRFLLSDIEVIIYILFAIMLSTITKNTAVSIGIPIFTYISSLGFMNILNKIINSEFVKFIPFNNFNLLNKIFVNYKSIIPQLRSTENIFVNNIQLSFSIKVVLICMLLFLVTTFDSFNKNDI